MELGAKLEKVAGWELPGRADICVFNWGWARSEFPDM